MCRSFVLMEDSDGEGLEGIVEYKGDKEFVSSTDALYEMSRLDEAASAEFLKRKDGRFNRELAKLSAKIGGTLSSAGTLALTIYHLAQYEPEHLFKADNPILWAAAALSLLTIVLGKSSLSSIRSFLRTRPDQAKAEYSTEDLDVFYSIDARSKKGYRLRTKPYKSGRNWEYLVTPIDNLEALEHLPEGEYVFINGMYVKSAEIRQNPQMKNKKRRIIEFATRKSAKDPTDYTLNIQGLMGKEEVFAEVGAATSEEARQAAEMLKREPHYIIGKITEKGIRIIHYSSAVLKPGVEPYKLRFDTATQLRAHIDLVKTE